LGIVTNIQIKHVPEAIHSRLVERARANGQSLQQYLLIELERLATMKRNAELFAEIESRGDLVELEPGLAARLINEHHESGRES
jgi:hypothetical protein